MNSNINTSNLIKEQSEGDGNLTISCNYNLLNNDNTVRWNGDEITLLKPYGLSNVKKICFRGFKGDLLPFTNTDLPKFRVEVVLTGENVGAANIEGVDGIYGEMKDYNIYHREGNTLLTFDKAWTYNAEEDNQLIYNIKEAVAEVNRRLKIMYPFKTYYNEFDISETYDNNYINKIYFDNDIIPINNNPGSTVLGWSKSLKKYVMAHINNSGAYEIVDLKMEIENDRHTIYASMSYNRNICVYVKEKTTSYVGLQHVRINTSAADNEFTYNWDINYNRWEDHTTRNNIFNFYPNSPSIVLGNVNNRDSICFSPMISREGEGRYLGLIFYNIDGPAKSRSIWCLDFTQRAKKNIVNILAYGDVIDKDGNAIDGLLAILAIYRDMNVPDDNVYTIGYFELNKSEISGDSNNPTVLINPIATKTINASEWTDRHKLMTCGKECYGVVKAVDASKTYIWFKGAFVLSYVNYDIDAFYLSEGYKYDNDNLFMFSDTDNIWALTVFVPPSGNLTSLIKDIISEEGGVPFIVTNKPSLKGVNPPLFIRGSANSIKGIISNPETYNTTYPDYSVDNPKYLNYEHINNALKCETEVELDMNVKGKDLNGGDIETLINKDYVITDSYNFFEFTEEGNIITSQICLTKGAALNMALKITTDPYYFEFTTPIDYYTSQKFSLIHPIVKPVFNTINEHVLNTVETLILLHYEYNNISLVSAQFPNIDGTIFYINEDSYVDFKTMAINNTSDGVRVKLLSNNESLSLTELKALYGKLCVAIDWIQ